MLPQSSACDTEHTHHDSETLYTLNDAKDEARNLFRNIHLHLPSKQKLEAISFIQKHADQLNSRLKGC
jgi:hypothetical protein